MDFGCWASLLRFLLFCQAAKSVFVLDGVSHTECRDRYFMVAVDLSSTGQEPHFEAVDGTGVFPITEDYAAQCGYTISILDGQDVVELRASYFSCHTSNQDDHTFTFSFNLIVTHDEELVSYAFNETCSPSLPWSPREVTCEVNYLEVSVKSEASCPVGPKGDGWDPSMQMVYGTAAPGWQMVMVKPGEAMTPMNLSEAFLHGYTFTVTQNRLVFRAAYGQPLSYRTMVDGISVEVAHAILFSRQEWHVLLVDLIASCTLFEAPEEDGGYLTWETPSALYPDLHTTNFSFGLDGALWEGDEVETMGIIVTNEDFIRIDIPYDVDGANRKSVVAEDLFDLYTCRFYMEQLATSEGGTETRTRTFRKLSSPLLRRFLQTEDRSVPDEETFTVFLGNVPKDLELVALHLNEEAFEAPFNSSSFALNVTDSPNDTYSYKLTVPFDSPLVITRFLVEEAANENELNIVFTAMIKDQSGSYDYHTTVKALSEVAPPQFDASCSENGITFKLDRKPSDYLWEFTVGSHPLTAQLAEQRGYILSNDSETLQLDVPLFTRGIKYEDITLGGFLGTFETNVRDAKTSEVQASTVKTCPFETKEFVVCSTEGRMTIVANLSDVAAIGGSPFESSLLDKQCAPEDADDTWALFSFPMNSCDTEVKLQKWSVTYKNEILYSVNSSSPLGRILVECTYPLLALHPFFSMFTFESEMAGIGTIVRQFDVPEALPEYVMTALSTTGPAAEPKRPAAEPTTVQTTTKSTTTKPHKVPARPSLRPFKPLWKPATKPTRMSTRKPAARPTRKPTRKTSSPARGLLPFRRPVKYVHVSSYDKTIQDLFK